MKYILLQKALKDGVILKMNKMNIIAEIGWNWMGDMKLAKKMIKAASDNGATHVKTQVFNEKYLKPGPWDLDGRREIYKKAQPSYTQLKEMKEYAEECDILFLASTMSLRDAELYSKVTTSIIKIPGFESRNRELLQFAFDKFDTVIISTGSSSVEEVESLLESLVLNRKQYYNMVLMHCVSSYPCLPEHANIERILDLARLTPNIGYSDHIEGIESVKVALEYSIEWVEKHFTTDHNLPGRDNKFAILPEELKALTDYLTFREKMKRYHGTSYQKCEEEVRNIQTGRFNG